MQLRITHGLLALLLVFIAATLIRSVPEIVAYPYVIGHDTVFYAGQIRVARSCSDVSPLAAPAASILVPVMLCFAGRILAAEMVMKVYAPIAYGFFGVALAIFVRKRLGASWVEAAVSAVFVLLQFGMLRISWDLHRNILALAFMLLLLSIPKDRMSLTGLVGSGILVVLVFVTHELTAVLMTAILGILTVTSLLKRERLSSLNLAALTLIGGTIVAYVAYTRPYLAAALFSGYVWPDTVRSVALFFALLNLPALMFLFLARRATRELMAWITVTATAGFSPVFLQVAVALWDRWMLMMIPPLGLLAANGLLRGAEFLTHSAGRVASYLLRASLPRRIAHVLLVALLFLPSVYLAWGFMTYPSEQPLWYFNNPELWRAGGSGIPATMLSNTVALHDVPDVIRVISELNKILGPSEAVLGHNVFYGWLLLYFDAPRNVIWFGYDPVDHAIAEAKQRGFQAIFLVWFVPETSWHTPQPDLSAFRVILTSGIIAAYVYTR